VEKNQGVDEVAEEEGRQAEEASKEGGESAQRAKDR